MSGSYGVAWSGGRARDWFWALLTAVKILVTARKGTPIISQEILPRHSQVDATFSSFVTSSPAIALKKSQCRAAVIIKPFLICRRSVHFFILFLKCCAALEAMFTMLIVQLEWVQTWLAVAELLKAESDIALLGLLLLLLLRHLE